MCNYLNISVDAYNRRDKKDWTLEKILTTPIGCYVSNAKSEKTFYNHNNKPMIERIGQSKIAKNGQKMTVIRYRNCKDLDVQFEDGTIVEHRTWYDFRMNVIENPNFKSARNISKSEFILLYYLKPYGFKHYKNIQGIGEIDCYNQKLKLGIEFDGSFWHKDKIDVDIKKNIACKKAGITLIRIRYDEKLNSKLIKQKLKEHNIKY